MPWIQAHRATTMLIVADMLIEIGFGVIAVESAAEALRVMASGQEISIVVSDHRMPGMTGTELARQIEAIYPDVPVLIITGFTDRLAHGLPRLKKPFHQDALETCLVSLTT